MSGMNANQIDRHDAEVIISLGIGRLLRLLSRPCQEGDEKQYYMARNAVLDAAEVLGLDSTQPESAASHLMRHRIIFGD